LFVVGHFENLIGDLEALFFVRKGFQYLDFFSFFVFGKDPFGDLFFVFVYDAVGGIDDRGRGTVILLQFEDFIVGIVVSEIQDVFNPGTPERIDALGIVTYNTDVAVDFRQFFDNQILGVVCVLVLFYSR